MAPESGELLSLFKAEAQDYLIAIETGLLRLEKDAGNLEILTTLFRSAHTLKGAARMMGFSQISELSHKIEDLFGQIQQGKLAFHANIANKILGAVSILKESLENIAQGKPEGIDLSLWDKQSLKTQKVSLKDQKKTAVVVKKPKAKQKEAPAPILNKGAEPVMLKSSRWRARPLKKAKSTTQETPPEEYIRVPLERVNRLFNLIGDMVVQLGKSAETQKVLKRIFHGTQEWQRLIANWNRRAPLYQNGSSSPEKIQALYHLLSQAEVRAKTIEKELSDFLINAQDHDFLMHPIVQELCDKMKEIRMLPCASVFETFPRLVRDIAHEQHKKIDFVMEGAETELDKKILETIKGPLIHLLRNAVDHGMEPQEIRQRLGKPETGTITLSAATQGDRVVITVTDDGGGIDIERVRETAVKKKIASVDKIRQMTNKEILDLIFLEGFSTAEKVTNISGRGVGLDVVRSEIERCQGLVEIATERNAGTTVKIELPLTIAIVKALLVEAGGSVWALPMTNLGEVFKVSLQSLSVEEDKKPYIFYRNQKIPLVTLSQSLSLPHSNGDLSKNSLRHAVIIKEMGVAVAFGVNRICAEEEVFIKSLGPYLGKVEGVSGAATLANGKLVAILDTEVLMDRARQLSAEALKNLLGDEKTKKILVVEDSFIVKELEKAILMGHGYQVETAGDGLEALQKMAQQSFDAVVSDIQMPRMDGFELCSKIKTHELLKKIPVVFVSTLSDEEYKKKSLEVGAEAYIIKGRFDQSNLLDTLEKLI